jgi:hypothetical protein
VVVVIPHIFFNTDFETFLRKISSSTLVSSMSSVNRRGNFFKRLSALCSLLCLSTSGINSLSVTALGLAAKPLIRTAFFHQHRYFFYYHELSKRERGLWL